MNTIDPLVLLAILQEMLGPLLWILLATAILAPLGFCLLVWREKRLNARRMLTSQALGLIGGISALVVMALASSSGFTDAGGPIDWLLIVAIFMAGAVITTLLAYAIVGWAQHCRRSACRTA